MRKPAVQFELDPVYWVVIGVAILLGFWWLALEGKISFPAFALIALTLPIPFFFVVVPAYLLARKVGQMLLGRRPPNELKGAEPIRFDLPREVDIEQQPVQFSLRAVFIAITAAAILLGAYPYLPLLEVYLPGIRASLDFFALLICMSVVVLASLAVGYRCLRFFRWLNKRPRP
jgi:hypothetical protein